MSFKTVSHGFLISSHVLRDSGEESIDISKYISDIMVRKRYIEDKFPLIVIDLRTTQEIRDIIRDAECKISLRVSYYTSDKTDLSSESDSTDVAEEGLLFDTVVRIYEKPFATTTARNDDELTSEEENQVGAAPFVYYRVSGVPEEQIQINEDNQNNIFKDAEPIDVLVYMLSQTCSGKNVYIQESENKNVYSNIIIPPVSLFPAIDYLQEYYPVYNNMISAFADFDGVYISSQTSKDRPTTNRIEVNVLESNSTTETSSNMPSLDENGNIKLVYKRIPPIENQKYIVDHLYGSETIYYSYDEFYNLSYRNMADNNTHKKVRYMWNDQGEKIFEDSSYSVKSTKCKISIAIHSLNPELINPFTIMRLNAIEYPEVVGDYSVGEISYMLTTGDFKHYTGSSVITFIKI